MREIDRKVCYNESDFDELFELEAIADKNITLHNENLLRNAILDKIITKVKQGDSYWFFANFKKKNYKKFLEDFITKAFDEVLTMDELSFQKIFLYEFN